MKNLDGGTTKHDDSSRPKTKAPPPSPGDEGYAEEGSTNEATEPVTKNETTTDVGVTVTNTIDTTSKAPNFHRPGGETRKPIGSLPNDLAEIEMCALACFD